MKLNNKQNKIHSNFPCYNGSAANISKGAITMDYAHSTTTKVVRKLGKHLTLDERGQIQALHREGFSLRAIAARVGCSHTAIHYELKRGTPERQAARGRSPEYTANRGQQAYLAHRKSSKRPYKIDGEVCAPCLRWMTEKIRKDKWLIDMCVGDVMANKRFDEEGILILSRTVDKFLTRKRTLKKSQPWSHRTVAVSPSEEAPPPFAEQIRRLFQ